MPFLKIQTNQEIVKVDSIILDASKLVAELLNKPEKYVMVEINVNHNMSFGGSKEPLIYCELKSIGLPTDRTKEISKQLMAFLEKETGISPSRMYIEFSDAKRNMWGWNSSTFE